MDKREKYFFVDNKQSFHDLLKTKDRVVALFTYLGVRFAENFCSFSNDMHGRETWILFVFRMTGKM